MALSSAKHILTKYPLAKGMLFYVITWPTGNIIQQTIDGKRWGNDFIPYQHHGMIFTFILINSFQNQIHTIGKCASDLHVTVRCMLHPVYMDG